MAGLLVTLALAVPRFEGAWLHRVATVAASRWHAGGVTYFLGLHSREPFLETVSTLWRMVKPL
jgi:hypothetical protein